MMKIQQPAFPLILFAAVILMVAGCRKVVDYPDEPSISFTSIVSQDSIDDLGNQVKRVTLTFHLIDGNGDMGLGVNDNEGPFAVDSAFYYNLFLQEYESIDGEFTEVPGPEGVRKYRIPDLTPTGQNKTLIADISVTVEYPYTQGNPLPYSTFRYEFQVVDRSFNFSNRDTTDVINW